MGTTVTLGEYLAAAARRKYALGTWDCAVFPADWVVMNGYPDPLAEWRGQYATDDVGESGLIDLFADGADAAGLIGTDEPREGDVGVISMLGQQAGGIFTGRRWAVVAPRGLACTSLEAECVLKAWRV